MANKEQLVIRGESAAWELLERALNKDPGVEALEISFSGWPKLEIVVKGRNLDGTIPSRFLPALQECQESIYRIYSYSKYGEYSTRRLKDNEKRDLELVYRIEKGSSQFGAQMAQTLEKIGMEAASRMTPLQLTTFLCLVALLFAGHSGFKHWLRFQERKLQNEDAASQRESSSRALEAVIESNRILAEANTRNEAQDVARDELLKQAISETKATKMAFEGASAAYERLARSMDPEDKLKLGSALIPGKELRSAVTSPRQPSQTYENVGAAVFKSVENDFSKGYVVSVRFLDTSFFVTTSIERNRLTDEEVACLSNAIFSGNAVWAHIDGLWRRGNIERARLISVRELEDSELESVPKSLGGRMPDST